MKKASLLNLIAIALILIIAVCSVMFIGSSREWFASAKDKNNVYAADIEGAVSVIRRGAGYSLKSGIALVEGDGLYTAASSSGSFDICEKGSFVMDARSEVYLTESKEDSVGLELSYGSFIFDLDPSEIHTAVSASPVTITAEEESVFSVESLYGTQTVKVFKGRVRVSCEGQEDISLTPGNKISAVQDENGSNSVTEVSPIMPQALSEFLIGRLKKSGKELCFTPEALTAELERRTAEEEAARLEREEYEKRIIAQGGTVKVVVKNQEALPMEGYTALSTCTISIVCNTILDNMDKLAPGKEAYVPANGVLLAPTHVAFEEGESVCDVLKRVCSYAGIPLEYSWTVAFGGYYIEGINNLCEFDCGSQSGWMYKVNGWFPNYGSSNYVLRDGDNIVWCYTCKGLGEDVGAPPVF